LMLFRCVEREYAEQFCRGELYFGTPRNWVRIGETGKAGQGDILEGVFLTTNERILLLIYVI